jgi:hypothetical protein
MIIELGRNISRISNFRDESYLSSSGCHEPGKVLHFIGVGEILSHTLAIPADEFHDARLGAVVPEEVVKFQQLERRMRLKLSWLSVLAD